MITGGKGSGGGTPSGRLKDHSVSACLGGYCTLMSELAPIAVELSALILLNVQYDLHFLQATHISFPRVPDHLDSLPHLRWHRTSCPCGSVGS